LFFKQILKIKTIFQKKNLKIQQNAFFLRAFLFFLSFLCHSRW
jgi:hypothetical protein